MDIGQGPQRLHFTFGLQRVAFPSEVYTVTMIALPNYEPVVKPLKFTIMNIAAHQGDGVYSVNHLHQHGPAIQKT